MRESKFKAKRKDNNEWVYGYVVIDKVGYSDNDTDEDIYYIAGNSDCYVEVLPDTVSQYTGLKDKNGVEIYENDKVKYDYEFSTEIGVITYNQNNASYQIKGISSSSMKHHKQLIVIGNIFDKECEK